MVAGEEEMPGARVKHHQNLDDGRRSRGLKPQSALSVIAPWSDGCTKTGNVRIHAALLERRRYWSKGSGNALWSSSTQRLGFMIVPQVLKKNVKHGLSLPHFVSCRDS